MANIHISKQMIDITAPDHVQIQIQGDGQVVWINVDGICRFRACNIKEIKLDDERLYEPCTNREFVTLCPTCKGEGFIEDKVEG